MFSLALTLISSISRLNTSSLPPDIASGSLFISYRLPVKLLSSVLLDLSLIPKACVP